MIINLAGGKDAGWKRHLDKIAKSHSRSGYDIKPELYKHWLNALIRTVSEVDPKFNREVEESWRKIFQGGIDYLKSKY